MWNSLVYVGSVWLGCLFVLRGIEIFVKGLHREIAGK